MQAIYPTPSHFPLPPGSCIGILGGGQLGQMIALAAKKLGYRSCIYDTIQDGPAAAVANEIIVSSFDDHEALNRFATRADVITLEFENIPASALETLALLKPVYPKPEVIRICQDRILEKEFLRTHGFPLAPFEVITSASELEKALSHFGTPCILKTATLGYDGKGQHTLQPGDDTVAAWDALKTNRAVLEKKISFLAEASVIIARSARGEVTSFPWQENHHRNGILDISITSPTFSEADSGAMMGKAIAEALEVIGLITVELFVLPGGSLLVNELAPRPHNSGHHTLESSKTSQFEQIIRAITGLPLGSTELISEAVMVNLLGDLWENGEPDWKVLLEDRRVHLHLYGKKEAKPDRKMGHFTIVGEHREELLATAKKLFQKLNRHIQGAFLQELK
ncbi:MAG: 5-(carboxyamino)imidazole ribonucleotide synthase [Chthoniobacterales bacterium]